MARVLLIDPCGWQGGVNSDIAFPNVGIAYLVASLRSVGHDVRVADMNNQEVGDEEIVRMIRSERIDIVGISVKTATMGAARRLGTCLKQQVGCIIVLGGAHANLQASDLIKESWVDYVFVGEAERSFPLFCHNPHEIARQQAPGIWKRGGVSGVSVHEPHLDEIPFPDYSLFPENVWAAVRANYPLVTSRGCVHECIYCSVPLISGKRFRKRSIENIIGELSMAVAQYGIERFSILDDAFNLDMRRAKDFCRRLLADDMRLRWSCPNGLRADRIDDELATLMFKSGCHSVMLGVETGDPAVFRNIRKGETLDDVARGILTFQRAGIAVGGYFLIGLPGDSMISNHRSVEFAKRYGISAHFNMLIPYPGTFLWDWVHAKGRVLLNIEEGLHFADSGSKVNPVYETEDFSAADRRRAYEMVHTQLDRFDMLIPRTCDGWRRRMRKLVLMLRHDRKRILAGIGGMLRDAIRIWRS